MTLPVIGFHASHEQIHPRQLLEDLRHAEDAGFVAALCSDHFSPWSTRQGHSGFAWAWLGAALASTGLPLGVVTAPGQRYHPAVLAQALGTLAAMYPERIWAALGSGEAVNERITGDPWPRKEVRDVRLRECVDVIRRLFAGDEVSHDGLVRVHRARLWSLPHPAPALAGAAVSVSTAGVVADWADGLITVNQPPNRLREVVDRYRSRGGRGPLRLQVHLSWASSEEEALAIAHDQWRTNIHPSPATWDIESAQVFDAVSQHVPPDAVRSTVLVSEDLDRHAAWLMEFADLGFDEIYLHHVGQEQARFIDTFGEKVLPQLDVRTSWP